MPTLISQNKTLSQTDVYSSLLEGKWHQSVVKPDKIEFLNEPKQTKLRKHKHGANAMHTNICGLSHDIYYTTVKQLCSTFFEKKIFYRIQHNMPFHNNNVKQNRLEGQT